MYVNWKDLTCIAALEYLPQGLIRHCTPVRNAAAAGSARSLMYSTTHTNSHNNSFNTRGMVLLYGSAKDQ